MGYVHAVVLGAIQGLTEFLPVSSSAHLILARALLGMDAARLGLPFDVACHLGTLVAVLVYFRRDVGAMVRALPGAVAGGTSGAARLVRLIAIGTLPAVVVGLAWATAIETHLRVPGVTVGTLALGALGLFAAERFGSGRRDEGGAGYRDAIAVGCAQALALVPGVSRSGATITVGMLLGLKRDAAARFSFLLGIPAILAAAAHAGIGLVATGITGPDVRVFLVGFAVSGLVGYAAIGGLLRYLGRHTLAAFAWYRLALAFAVAAWMWSAGG